MQVRNEGGYLVPPVDGEYDANACGKGDEVAKDPRELLHQRLQGPEPL